MTATNIVASKYFHGTLGTPERFTGESIARAYDTRYCGDDLDQWEHTVAATQPKWQRDAKELRLTVATYGHAGDGNLHANILFDLPSDRPKVDEAVRQMLELTLSVGGTITGEHGVGCRAGARPGAVPACRARPDPR